MRSTYSLQVLSSVGGWVSIRTFAGKEGLDFAVDFARSLFRAAPPDVHFRVVLSNFGGVVTDEVMFSTQQARGSL